MAVPDPDRRAETPGARYERDMVPAMFEPFARDLVGRLELRDQMRIADIGCGTGIVARLIGENLNATSSVIGIDINAGMLDVARAKSTNLPCNFDWQEASADTLPFEDASIDLLVCQYAFMLFPDKSGASREMYRVLRHGAPLYVSVWRHFSNQANYAALISGLDRLVGEQAADLLKSAFQYETEDQIRAPILEGGFRRVGIETVKMDVVPRRR